MEYKISMESDERDELVRALRADDAFYLVSEIKDKIRTMLKHGDQYEQCLEEIHELIYESGLMDHYN